MGAASQTLQAMQEAELDSIELLICYANRDSGDLDDEHKAEKDPSVEKVFRILSAYELQTDVKI